MVAGTETEPWGLLAQFLNGMLKFLGITELVKNTKCVIVTLAGTWRYCAGGKFPEGFCRALDFPMINICSRIMQRVSIIICSPRSKEIWNRSVAWYAFTPEKVIHSAN